MEMTVHPPGKRVRNSGGWRDGRVKEDGYERRASVRSRG